MKQKMRQFFGVADKVEDSILLFLNTAIVIVVFSGVLIRYTPFTGKLVWTAEIARISFLWLIFLAAARTERFDRHYKADIVPLILRGKTQILNSCLMNLIALIGFAFLIWSAYCYNLSQIGAVTQQLQWPAIARSLPLLLCSILMFAYNLIALVKNIGRL